MLKSAIWQLFGAIGSANAVKRKIAEVTTLTGRGSWFPGPYNDRPIWTSVSERIRMTDYGKIKDIQPITLDTRSRSQVVYVLETILQEWYQNSGILNAWHAGQVAAYKLQYDSLSPDFTSLLVPFGLRPLQIDLLDKDEGLLKQFLEHKIQIIV
ncbi:hypothetical protein DM02DRAFT_648418 [Periconia macrospinosa]|uniref:Uncharacterized protein n=1 Tax=Periconia macrospinosa TaxID=97972 RepID=A0A2V1EBC7_9PLEO|nr:hypothetical protein DM02DRAFT_648418 [Periconia macrospinosa]